MNSSALVPVQGARTPVYREEWQYEATSQGQTRWMAMSPDFNFRLEVLYNQYLEQQATLPASQVQHTFQHMYYGNERRGCVVHTVDFINHVQTNNWGESFRIRKVGISVVFGPQN